MISAMSPRRIDAHVHLWELARGDYFWMSPAQGCLYRDFRAHDLLAVLDDAGVDGAVLVQAAPTVAETRYLLDIAARTARICGVVGWVDFESDGVRASLESLLADGKFKAVRPMMESLPDPAWMVGESVQHAWRTLEALDVAVDFLVTPAHLEFLHRLLDRHPGLRGVIDHGAKPAIGKGEFGDWSKWIKRIADSSGVFCKLSGLLTEAAGRGTREALQPYVDVLVGEFGPGRLMFGSDWPVLTRSADYVAWYDLAQELLSGLSPEARALIFGGTAERFYRLARAPAA